MAEQIPLVIINGLVQQLPSGDTLPIGVLPSVSTSSDKVLLTNVSAEVIPPGAPVYVAGDGEVTRAQADAVGTASVIGLACESIPAFTGFGLIQVDGIVTLTTSQWDVITDDFGGLVPNFIYYLSHVTPPPMLQTAVPTGSGNFITVVGIALSKTKMKLIIERPIIIP
jgi:hypothetical protein